MDFEKTRFGKVKSDKNREITYSAENGAEIRATLTYRTLSGEWLATIRYYNRAECLHDFACIIGNKALLSKVERTEQYQAWLDS